MTSVELTEAFSVRSALEAPDAVTSTRNWLAPAARGSAHALQVPMLQHRFRAAPAPLRCLHGIPQVAQRTSLRLGKAGQASGHGP